MALLLILTSFLTLLTTFKVNRNEDCLRSAFLKASVVHGLIFSIITELLSSKQSLTFEGVAFEWSLLALINCSILVLLAYRNSNSLNLLQIPKKIWIKFKSQALYSKFVISGVIIVLSISLVIALIAPPNNYDSMTYHMPRVMHWIQNRSVAHYPTHNLRQISFSPGVSYIVTHLQILSGGDRFANCIQWFTFLGSVLGISLIAKNLGGVQTQSIAALVCASIPMAIMQSTTTQTDLVVSYWLVCFSYFIFRSSKYSKSDLFWLSASLGLAILAKPTGIIFGIPLLIIFGLRTQGAFVFFPSLFFLVKSTIVSGIILIFSIVLSLPSYYRNYGTFGNFLGTDTGTRNTNIGVIELISNLLKNLALNLPFPGVWSLVENVHKYILKLDVNDSATTMEGNSFAFDSLWRILLPDEDFVGSPVHFTLLCSAIITLIAAVGLRKTKNLSGLLELLVGNIIGLLLYCLLLKWQMWANRLLLPFFILTAPVTGYFIACCLPKTIQRTLSVILICIAIFYSITPIHRPLVALPSSRSHLSQSESILQLKHENIYFSGYGKFIKPAYTKLANLVKENKCRSIGLDIGSDDWEYPIWTLINSKDSTTSKIKHVNVKNESQSLAPEFFDSDLCAIFTRKGVDIKFYVKPNKS